MTISSPDMPTPARRFFSIIPKLAPGDALIVLVLVCITGLACIVGALALMRSYQIAVPAEGGTLVEGMVGAPRVINPLLAVTDTDRDLVALTYAGLMGHDAQGTLIPVLAQSYDVSPDGTQYTFTLRENAVFSDGTQVTADDVVFTVAKAQDPGLQSSVYASWVNIAAEVVDARSVRFTLPQPYPLFLEDATLGILPQRLWRNVTNEEFAFGARSLRPVGAGPFTVTDVDTNSEDRVTRMTLSAFDQYALGRPYLSRIQVRFYEDYGRLRQAIETGEVTSAYGIPGEQVYATPYARIIGVFFNPALQPSLEDLGVRKALSLAIDRTRITEEALGGFATPTNGPVPVGVGVPELPLPSSATRLIEASAALAESGWEQDETGAWTLEGETLSMVLQTSNVPELRAVALAVEEDWEAFGVSTEIQFSDPDTLTQTVIRPRTYSALLFGEVVGTDPDLFPFWASTEREDPGLNITQFGDEEVDAVLEASRTTTGQEKLALLAQAQEAIATQYPAAFLYTPDFVYSTPQKLKNVRISRIGTPRDRFWGVSDWHFYTEHVWPIFVPE